MYSDAWNNLCVDLLRSYSCADLLRSYLCGPASELLVCRHASELLVQSCFGVTCVQACFGVTCVYLCADLLRSYLCADRLRSYWFCCRSDFLSRAVHLTLCCNHLITGNTVRLLGQKKFKSKKLGGAALDLPKIRRNPLIEIISINTG